MRKLCNRASRFQRHSRPLLTCGAPPSISEILFSCFCERLSFARAHGVSCRIGLRLSRADSAGTGALTASLGVFPLGHARSEIDFTENLLLAALAHVRRMAVVIPVEPDDTRNFRYPTDLPSDPLRGTTAHVADDDLVPTHPPPLPLVMCCHEFQLLAQHEGRRSC